MQRILYTLGGAMLLIVTIMLVLIAKNASPASSQLPKKIVDDPITYPLPQKSKTH